MTERADGRVTILEVLEARRASRGLLALDSYTAGDFKDYGLSMLGGCHSCGESLAAYNGYPDTNGYWACRECLREGYPTVESFEAGSAAGPFESLTVGQVEELGRDARVAGDIEMAELCERAVAGDVAAQEAVVAAIRASDDEDDE